MKDNSGAGEFRSFPGTHLRLVLGGIAIGGAARYTVKVPTGSHFLV